MKKVQILFFAIIECALIACAVGHTSNKENMITLKVGKTPTSIEVADLDNDKIPDLVIANGGDSSVTILLGKVNGAFTEAKGSPFYAGCTPNDVVIADFNKDGKPDLAFANHTKKYLTVLAGEGDGSFKPLKGSPFAVDVIPHTHGVAAGDFNKDGNTDLVTDSWGNDRIEILFGNNKHGFNTPGTFIKVGKHPYQRIRTADLNMDGNTDIVTTNLDGNNATILLGNGKSGFYEPPGSPFACGDSPFGAAVGDINGDGKPDLAIVNSPTITSSNTGRDGLTILIGDGSGKFVIMPGSPFTAGKSPSRVAIGDINGDGINDIAVANYNSNSITVFLMNRHAVVSSYTVPVGQKPDGITIADVNGDGKNEILVTNSLDNTLNIIETAK
ncbi:FG-GAP repeat domain-containing protein [Mucilaginibacter sp. McL0603]|uniref:FG-GAP repeat domain-containing protein n=1 Tax=Mucilaginibacter sp. McL0603 TaxID=3415670 RepID=UPI003CF933FA